MLTDEELRQAPYQVENSSHRKAITMELEWVKMRGVKPPQNLWEYKVSVCCRVKWSRWSFLSTAQTVLIQRIKTEGQQPWPLHPPG